MRIINAGYEILSKISGDELQFIERAARTCYKSCDKIAPGTAEKMIRMLIGKGHEAMLEHSQLSVKFICDRGVSHEIVRHRIASFAQESTRYCNYSADKFGNEISVIKPCFFEEDTVNFNIWKDTVKRSEEAYFMMLSNGCSAQEARSVLPNSLATELVMTANYREWRNFFKLRTAPDAHPQMREITIPLLKFLQQKIPVIFEDIDYGTERV